MNAPDIILRGVRVNNLKGVDLDLPSRRWISICGVSGSGKSSLALDTLYAEGQRRYLESFSAYTRQFLDRLAKPDAERLDNLPVAIAVAQAGGSPSSRSTVGSATEVLDYLRLVFAKIGRVYCQGCRRWLRRENPHSVADRLRTLPAAARLLVGFEQALAADEFEEFAAQWREDGLLRIILNGVTRRLDEPLEAAGARQALVVVDRLSGGGDLDRLTDSLETAFARGGGRCCVLIDSHNFPVWAAEHDPGDQVRGVALEVDQKPWTRVRFQRELYCEDCDREYPTPEPRLYSFNSPLGACRVCEGFGSVSEIDMDRIVPDRKKSLRQGAVAPWNTPAYAHELEELLALASDVDLPVDVPFEQLTDAHLKILHKGSPPHNFGGLDGFFAWLERRKYKMHIRVFLSRWRSYRDCPACHGDRLREEALATLVGGRNMAEICRMKVADALAFFDALEVDEANARVGGVLLERIGGQLRYLDSVGIGYLTLDRTLRTLSGGESQRVALSSALGSNLTNMMYVLDEPTNGLHPHDIGRLIGAIEQLRRRGNTLIVVEHEESLLRASEHLIEVGPGAGQSGGEIVYQGDVAGMLCDKHSITGSFLAGRRGASPPAERRRGKGSLRLLGARGNNLKQIDVEFPLGVLCLVTGVSGSGKSTLVQDTLYGAICRRKKKDAPETLPYEDVLGDGQLDDVVLIDSSPIGRSPRSNPVTYSKAFDPIRALFAQTLDARTHNYEAGHFSFNVDGGRCTHCKGDGFLKKDMQFLADVYMKCDQCQGKRYRSEILDVRYRGRNIAEVLDMTVREAFAFFRRQTKVQARLKPLIDVGLDYLRLGQPANTLSRGEAQRVKLAGCLAMSNRQRMLLLLDEPTAGLHFADIVKLLDCFEALLSVGHSLIIVEHNLQMMRSADWIIDLGPGPGELGGQVVAQGPPEEIMACPQSATGRHLHRVPPADADTSP